MKAMQSTWSPFQSPEVRDICAHLTAAEKQQLLAQSFQHGRDTGWRFAFPFALVVVSFFYSRLVGFVLLVPFIIYCLTVERHRIHAHQQRVREFLAATGFAKAHGYRPEMLRMFSFPWSR
jgi:hypothetical protein